MALSIHSQGQKHHKVDSNKHVKISKHQRDKTNEAKQKQRNRVLKIDKPSKIETKICKEKQTENGIRVFGFKYTCSYIGHAQRNYMRMRMHASHMCTHASSMHMHTRPRTLTQNL